jgi:hypothetical protein
VSWDDCFRQFEENGLAFLYRDQKGGADDRTFFKLVRRRRILSRRARGTHGSHELLHSDSTWRAHVIDRLRSLTRALAVVRLFGRGRLGIAVWALLAEDDDDGRARARAVCALEDRVERLEAEVDRAPSRVVVSVRHEQRSLDGRLDELEQDTSEAIEGLRQEVRELEDRVDELRQQLDRPTAPER